MNRNEYIAWNLRIAAQARRNKDYFWARAIIGWLRQNKGTY